MNSCIVWAVAMYLRRRRRSKLLKLQGLPSFDCYVIMRRSREAWYPHFLYGERKHSGTRVRLIRCVPLDSSDDSVPWPIFRGRVKWGDIPKK